MVVLLARLMKTVRKLPGTLPLCTMAQLAAIGRTCLRLHTPEANRPRIESIDFKRLGIEKIDFRGPGGDTIDSSGLATKELGFLEAWG